MPGDSYLQLHTTPVDERLSQLIPNSNETPAKLHEAMRYSALAPGKRLRPVITLAAAECLGSAPAVALDAGCATELVHCFSLIHDDLPAIDDDDLRRGRPTCHKVFGEAMAILAGDALFALAFEVVANCSADGQKSAACVKALAHATGSLGLVGGEVLDILSEGADGDLVILQTIHLRKTGALLGACCEIGGILGGANQSEAATLSDFGNKVGLAFQVADDVLNETSTTLQLGKAVGSDIARDKLTYPKLLGLEASLNLAHHLVKEATELVQPFGSSANHLVELAHYSIKRDW